MSDYPEISELLALQKRLNLFAHLDENSLLREANSPRGQGSLQGRVVGLKANIAVSGAKWSAGLSCRAERVAQEDAGLTRRLRKHGALVLPGLNMDAAALGGATDNPDFGRTANPRAPGHSAGGSSGGSAAAVASGLVGLAIGTDTLGSIRIPASYCGVFGLKPTFGLVGRSGVVPLASSFDTAGPITARAADLWTLLLAISGPDANDPDSSRAPDKWFSAKVVKNVAHLRVGIPQQIDTVDCEPEVLEALELAKNALQRAGAKICTIEMPGWHPARLRNKAFVLTEAEGAVAFKAELETRGHLTPSVEKMLAYGRDLNSQKLVSALVECRAAKMQLQRSFADIDVLLSPTTPHRAFDAGRTAPVQQADFTVLANVGGVPAVAVPVNLQGEDLPASVQMVGPAWSEATLVGAAIELEQSL